MQSIIFKLILVYKRYGHASIISSSSSYQTGTKMESFYEAYMML